MKKFTQQLFFFAVMCLACTQLQAQASLSVQGSLQNFNGSAVDNGTYDITFKLYTTDVGGTPIWTEVQSVNIIGGVYAVRLGEVNPLNIPFDQTYYLGLTIPGGPEHTPRAQLTASPYALALLGQDNKFPSTGLVKMSAMATGTDITTATAYTVAANDHVIYLDHTANQNVTLPAATTANAGRNLMLVNKATVAKTLTSSNYVDLAGATSTTVGANSVVELQSDGSVWRQTGGYVQPASVGKAYVYCRGASATTTVTSSGIKIPFTEISDAQNCWNSTNHTFTAPRAGIYRISGVLPIAFSGTNTLHLSLTVPVVTNAIAFLRAESTGTTYHQIPFNIDYQMTAGQQLDVWCASTFGSTVLTFGNSTTQVGHLTITEQ